jgi:hypothetical protein
VCQLPTCQHKHTKAIRSISSGSVKVAAFPFPEFGFYCNQFTVPSSSSSSSSSNQDVFHEDIVDCNQQITPDTFRLFMLHLKQEQQSKHSFFSSASSLSATTLSPSSLSSFQKSKIMTLLTYVNKMYSPKTLTSNSNLYPVVVQLVKNLNGLISQLEGSYVNSVVDYAQQSVPSSQTTTTTTSQEGGGQGDSTHSNDVRHHIEEELLSQCLPYSAFPPFAYVL